MKIYSIVFLFFLTSVFAEKKEEIEIKKLSESLGYIIANNIEELGIEIDIDNVIKGIKKANKKKPSPMNEEECLEKIKQLQISYNEIISSKNLKKAEEFLNQNAKDASIIEIEKSKLQYKILKKGDGRIVNDYNNPIVKIEGKYLNGKLFTSSEELIILSETIPGLKKALIGMKENEKRSVFIHPDLAFGKDNQSLNNLVIFNVEVIKADSQPQVLSKETADESHTF